jgi:L-alanine-DL-glutamate epimerase-like enolase superfamily enzyme
VQLPYVGAEHRARLVNELLGPLVLDSLYDSPQSAFEGLTARTAVLAIQSGEPGPLAQAIAGLDTALWDIAAKRANAPLWSFLGGEKPRIPVYASGINPDRPEKVVNAMHARGHRAFKLKVGFGDDLDFRNLQAIRQGAGAGAALAVDANQAWTFDQAAALIPRFETYDLRWIEEPLRADRPWSEWRALGRLIKVPLAAGENIAGAEAFSDALRQQVLKIVQPDVAKWGGVSGCYPVARSIVQAGLSYCPHYLGGGIGLLASAHLLAAAGGSGMLEIDVNPNPLRDELCGSICDVENGHIVLSEKPGLGIEPDFRTLQSFRIERQAVSPVRQTSSH